MHLAHFAHNGEAVVKPGPRIMVEDCGLVIEAVLEPDMVLPMSCGNSRALADYRVFQADCKAHCRRPGTLPSRGEAAECRIDRKHSS